MDFIFCSHVSERSNILVLLFMKEVLVVDMKYDALLIFRKQIKQFSEMSNEKIDMWARLMTKVAYNTDDYYSTPETPSTSLGYVARGLFRLYVVDRSGNEATLAFTGENMFMSSYGAFILNQIQPVYIQALEDSEVYVISRTEFLKFWETDAELKDVLQKVTELDCLRIRKREIGFLLYDAQTRYFNFLEDFQKYANRIKLWYIASYLGISPETLSRIRKKTE